VAVVDVGSAVVAAGTAAVAATVVIVVAAAGAKTSVAIANRAGKQLGTLGLA
jgi:hypothetical protein